MDIYGTEEAQESVEQIDLLSAVCHSEHVQAEMPVTDVYLKFQGSPHDFLGVLDGVKLTGLCSRSQVGNLLGHKYGFAIFSRQQIGNYCVKNPVYITRGTPLREVFRKALSRIGREFDEDVILVDDAGNYLGLIQVQALVRLQSKLVLENIHLLETQQLALRNKNMELVEKSKQLNSTNQELSDARDMALESARLKSIFLATMSHEIRTPMNGVLGMLNLLIDTELTPEQEDYAKTATSSADALLSVINDILDFSKIEAGKLTISNGGVDMVNLVREIEKLLAGRATNKGVHFESNVDPGVPKRIVGDLGRIRQVLINLVGNAIKFTPLGSISVNVRCEQPADEKAQIVFEIQDTGIGMSEEASKKLFQPFSQVDGSNTRKYGGTGLGLAISKQLVELMGGQIGFSTQPGIGSTFWFRLPLGVVPTAKDNVVPHDKAKSAATVTQKNVLVLVVEDAPVNQKVIILQLRKLGYQTCLAENGQEALVLFQSMPVDIILMDCQMPVMDGFEATRAIRSLPQGVHVPIVALTANAMDGEKEKCMCEGMDDFLTKPLKLDELKKMLEIWECDKKAEPLECGCSV